MRIAGTLFTDEGNPISAKNFCQSLHVIVDDNKLNDADFRKLVRNSLPLVEYPRPEAK